MTDHPQRVFLSYTGEDLREYAHGIAEALRRFGHEPVDHTDWAANGMPSVKECRERVAGCTLLVVLVAQRFGWVPSVSEGGDGERSITWLEVEEARRVGIPVLPFLLAETASWPQQHMEGLRNPKAFERLERFKEQLKKGLCGFFSTPDKLTHEVVRAVETAANRLAQKPAQAHKPAHQDEFTLYRQRLERQLRRVKFLGFGEQFQVSLPISELWVPLTASVPRSLVAEEGRAPERKDFHAEVVRDTRVEDAFRKAREYDLRALAMLGDPGSGKTTAARRLAWQCADLVQGPSSLGLPEDVVPVLLRLRELPREEVALGLEPMLRRQLASMALSEDERLGERLLKRGRVLWILDGLDEVASLEARTTVSRWIRQAHDRRTEDWFLVTSRHAGYEGEKAVHLGEDFLVLQVSPLSSAQRRDFVTRWYRTVERQIRGDEPDAHALAVERSEQLLALLESQKVTASRRLASMAANPLLLSILCIVHRRDMSLPRRRADLYAKSVDVLLDSWRFEWRSLQGRVALDAGIARLVLQSLAWHLHQKESRTEDEVESLLPVVQAALERVRGAREGPNDPRAFLDTLHKDSGVLVVAKPGHYAFLHLTFQEYLVARHCIDAGKAEELASHFGTAWWNEPILLALSMAPNDAFVADFFRKVFDAGLVRDEDARTLLRSCIDEALILPKAPFLERLGSPETPPELLRVLVQRFKDSQDADLARVASVLDQRLRDAEVREARLTAKLAVTDAVETRTDERTGIVLVKIPAGAFDMGGTRYDDEKPVHRVELESFWLAAHPVTNAQYERFLHATDHPAPKYWTDSKYNAPSQPVVGLSWEDAQAYCKWAGLALPSEAQWEYACRAGTRTEYWSGNAKTDLSFVGWFDENSDGKLHAVAEKSPSPFGLYDTHGNIWEWCEDVWHRNYSNAPRDGRAWVDAASEDRVLRGGSFGLSAGNARSAFRSGDNPFVRWHHVGFRPARSGTVD